MLTADELYQKAVDAYISERFNVDVEPGSGDFTMNEAYSYSSVTFEDATIYISWRTTDGELGGQTVYDDFAGVVRGLVTTAAALEVGT